MRDGVMVTALTFLLRYHISVRTSTLNFALLNGTFRHYILTLFHHYISKEVQ